MIRTIAEFKTSIPDDTDLDEDRVYTFGGRAVALVIAQMLTEQGFTVEDPEYAEEHGWELTARVVRERVRTRLWFQVTLPDEVVLQTEDTTFSIFGRIDHTVFPKTLIRLNEQLTADPRFSDVVWFPERSYDRREGGAPTPVS